MVMTLLQHRINPVQQRYNAALTALKTVPRLIDALQYPVSKTELANKFLTASVVCPTLNHHTTGRPLAIVGRRVNLASRNRLFLPAFLASGGPHYSCTFR